MVSISSEDLRYYIDHVFLPPKISQQADNCEHARSAEQGLLRLLHDSTKSFQDSQTSAECSSGAWKSIERMVECWITLDSTPSIANLALCTALADIKHTGSPPNFENLEVHCANYTLSIGVIAVQIRAQNALLLIRNCDSDIILQCCEVLPEAEAVITCRGNLIRTFPAYALAIPYSTFANPNFREELARRLCSLDSEVIKEMMPQTSKAGSKTGETRDSVHPALVTEMLMHMLAPLGHPVGVRQVRKRTRDDVLWKSAELPWRRSGLWLSVRVALQMALISIMPSKETRTAYKNFIIFFMTKIASLVADVPFSSDLLQVVKVKLARRVFKLGRSCITFVHDQALEVCERLKAIQQRRWQKIVDNDAKRHTNLETSSFNGDTSLTLNTSSSHLQAMLTPSTLTAISISPVLPQCPVWLDMSDGLPKLSSMTSQKQETHFVIFEFERWVSGTLPQWLRSASNFPSSAQCMELWELASFYHTNASTLYNQSPEGNSTMILVLAELWGAIDIIASKIQPLLCRFGPEIPINLFSPLLLPRRGQIDRLRKIELYITARYEQTVTGNPSIFSGPSKGCFAAQLYDASENYQALRRKIGESAKIQISQKQTEWTTKFQKYRELVDGAKAMTCQTSLDTFYNEERHILSSCPRCTTLRVAEDMSMDKYERPLPEDAVQCAAAVVELDFPSEMVAWRNMTWMLVHDIGRSRKTPGPLPAETLLGYSGLQQFASTKGSNISLASVTKSYTQTHYKKVKFPVEFENCVVNNALQYRLRDERFGCWLHDQKSTPSIDVRCITQLPEGPYANLQYAVDATSHTQNRVIAEQGSCSAKLSLPEFVSFGSLRADGERTQWLNIKRELGSSNLNSNAEAVYILFRQAAWQAGSYNNSPYRVTHTECDDKAFCHELLSILERNVESVKASWKNDNALLLFATITLRILSLSLRPDIKNMALGLLLKIREVAHSWTEILGQIIHDTTAPKVLLRLQHCRLKSAILCKMTFDVDESDLPKLLATANDVCTWILCSNTVQENTSKDGIELKRDLRLLLLRDMNLSHRLFRRVRTLIIQGNQGGLNKAIRYIWSGFEPTSAGWTALQESSSQRWIMTVTEAKPGKASQRVLYNLLEGRLLVDGVPMGSLSKRYTESESYLHILGAQPIRVFTADMEGMHYMSAQQINGYIIYFGIREKDVSIRLKQGSQVWELVSHHVFSQDLPSSFITDYTHWLDIGKQEIEFRPKNNPWKSSPEHWRLMYRPNLNSQLIQGKRKLVDVRSRTFAVATKIFGALDEWQHMHVTLVNDNRLEVALPRLNLRFFLKANGDMECYELRRVVDPDQSLGTLIGLRSRLILCGSEAIARNHDRLLIIPEGEISVSQSSDHVRVNISACNSNARIFRYHIDATLQCLRPGADKLGNLYIAYLHALTSHVLPDPFTNLTGTEEALQLLRLNSMSLLKPASIQEAMLLRSVAALTPTREYYPSHLKVMQSVTWDSRLSMFTQHDDFLALAERILTSGSRYADFYSEAHSKPSLRAGYDQELLMRAQIRHSSHRSSDFGNQDLSTKHDSVYQARDVQAPSHRAHRVHEIAALIASWPRKLEVSRNIGRELYDLGAMSNFLLPFDSSKPLSELLALPLDSSWAPLHNTCRSSSRETDTFKLLFLFSAIAYGRSFTSTIPLKTLLAFAFVPELRETCHLPKHSSYNLEDGAKFDESRLWQVAADHFRSSTAYNHDISDEQYTKKLEAVEKQKKEQFDRMVNGYSIQWPCRHPVAPDWVTYKDFDVRRIHPKIVALFSSWRRNADFDPYLQKVHQILAQVHEIAPLVPYVTWQQLDEKQETQESCELPILAKVIASAPPPEGCELECFIGERRPTTANENSRLRGLVKGLKSKHRSNYCGSFREIYIDDLLASLDALNSHEDVITPIDLPLSHLDILAYHNRCLNVVAKLFQRIIEALSLSHSNHKILQAADIWPRATTRSLLAFLSTSAPRSLTQPWKASLLTFGKAITKLQRARRLLLAREHGDVSTFYGELDNDGHVGWEVEKWPDWLLIEIENDFLIRPTQARVALEMIQPHSAANSLIQLNMGW